METKYELKGKIKEISKTEKITGDTESEKFNLAIAISETETVKVQTDDPEIMDIFKPKQDVKVIIQRLDQTLEEATGGQDGTGKKD